MYLGLTSQRVLLAEGIEPGCAKPAPRPKPTQARPVVRPTQAPELERPAAEAPVLIVDSDPEQEPEVQPRRR